MKPEGSSYMGENAGGSSLMANDQSAPLIDPRRVPGSMMVTNGGDEEQQAATVASSFEIAPPDDDDDNSLLVGEIKGGDQKKEWSKKAKKRLALLGLGVVAVGVVLSILLPGNTGSPPSDDEPPLTQSSSAGTLIPASSDPAPPTAAPLDPVTAHDPTPLGFQRPSMNEIVDWIANRGISNKTALLTADSPQNKAARWLAEQDGLPQKELPTDNELDGNHDEENDDMMMMYMVRYVMAVIFYSLNGHDWLDSVNFLSPVLEVCRWNGLSHTSVATYEQGGLVCDKKTGLPIKLDLEFNNLSGEIPTEIGMLSTLELVDFSANDNIVGEIPTEICNLSSLKILNLEMNQIRGEIPACITIMKALEVIHFTGNDLVGYIPDSPELCNLTNMCKLVLDKNSLEGEIPDCVYKWTNLEVLSVSDNKFFGTISTELGKLAKLKKLYLDGNEFKGEIIPPVNKLTDLELLYIDNNQFEGTLDENLFKDLSNLRALDISSNNFKSVDYGIPTHILGLNSLEILDLSQNALQGQIPETVPQNHNLKFLSVHENNMTGGIPSQLINLTGLLHLDLSNNAFHGPIRKEIFQLHSIRHIFLSENPGLHSGPIPSTLQELTQLCQLSMKNTNRTGPLPEMLGFDNLFLLDLVNNKFTGTVPSNYGQLPTLRHLLLNRNPLTGDLPTFENLNLETVLLDGTGLTGGDFNSICELEGFKGANAAKYGSIAVADCGGDNNSSRQIECECCHCCNPDVHPYCTDPSVASLDWTWEFGWTRSVWDFNLNFTLLENPQNAADDGNRKLLGL